MKQCGQVFLASNKNFVINCTHCKIILTDFNSFQIHVLETHFDSIPINKLEITDFCKNIENLKRKTLIKKLASKNLIQHKIKTEEEATKNFCDFTDSSQNSCDNKRFKITSIKKEKSEDFENLEKQNEDFSLCETEITESNLSSDQLNIKLKNNIDTELDIFSCSVCEKKFLSHEKFKQHEVRKKCGSCPVCSLKFSHLYDHIRNQHKEYYEEKLVVQESIIVINDTISETQRNCEGNVLKINENETENKDLNNKNISEIKNNCKKVFYENEKVRCEYCGELFYPEYFPTHQSQRRCGKCPVCLTIVSDLFRHVPKFHKEYVEEKRILKEKVVKRVPLNEEELFLLKLKEKSQNLELGIVNMKNLNQNQAQTNNNLQKGINEVKKVLFCMYCEKTFKSKGFYNNHIKQHETKSDTCKYCGKRFKYSSRLKKHLRLHTGERPYQCEICSVSFNESTNLKAHFINRHTEGLHLKCTHENCEKVFKTNARRRYHEFYAHSNKYKNLCKECGLIFRTSGSLNEHYKRKHIKYEDREFSCSYCDKKFAFKFELVPHEMLHLGQKKYQCELCLKGFIARKSFKRHCREVHGKEIEEISKNE